MTLPDFESASYREGNFPPGINFHPLLPKFYLDKSIAVGAPTSKVGSFNTSPDNSRKELLYPSNLPFEIWSSRSSEDDQF